MSTPIDMRNRISPLVIICIIGISIASCGLHGSYKGSFNSRIKLKKDDTFDYEFESGFHGTHEAKVTGKWSSSENEISLTEDSTKFAKNEIDEVGNFERDYIAIYALGERTLPFQPVELYGSDTVLLKSDIDGFIYLDAHNLKDYDRLIVKEGDPLNLTLADYNIENINSRSVILKIDQIGIGKNTCFQCPYRLRKKGGRLYVVDEDGSIDKEYFFRKRLRLFNGN